MKVVCIIPSRMGSKRLPGKPLIKILGKPMIQLVWEGCSSVLNPKRIFVATDSEEIVDVVKGFGGNFVLTSSRPRSGTERVAEALKYLNSSFDVVLNVQGDEPLVTKEAIEKTIRCVSQAEISTVCKKIKEEEIKNPNVVKVLRDFKGFALYFSRLPLPNSFRHIGIYAFRTEVLKKLVKLKPSPLETSENLEQLRALWYGFKIKVGEVFEEMWPVDTFDDIKIVEEILKVRMGEGG